MKFKVFLYTALAVELIVIVGLFFGSLANSVALPSEELGATIDQIALNESLTDSVDLQRRARQKLLLMVAKLSALPALIILLGGGVVLWNARASGYARGYARSARQEGLPKEPRRTNDGCPADQVVQYRIDTGLVVELRDSHQDIHE